jgi:uncharacterized protein YndB with AHSA1/START domain
MTLGYEGAPMKITHTIEINREPADVFAYLTDPAKLSTWQTTTVAVVREGTGPLVLGERFDEIHKAFGHESRTTVDVVAYEEPRVFELHIVKGPLPLDGRWELEPTGTGTRVQFLGHGDIRGLKRFSKPMLVRQFRHYHRLLKNALEAGAH